MIQSQTIKKIRSICLYTVVSISLVSNIVNYFYAYRYLHDKVLQWRIAMISIALVLFLSSTYIWLTETLKNYNSVKIMITGWLTFYLFANLVGVLMGYTLHTKGFMMVLFTIIGLGFAHISAKLWQRYYL